MVTTRPHILKWRTKDGEAGTTAEGYPIPGTPGEEVTTSCRFYPEKSKMLKNEDSSEVMQEGKIRIEKGAAVPHLWASVIVKDLDGILIYEGLVKNRFVGQLSGGWVEV